MKDKINIYDAKAQLSKLISRVVDHGETIVICKHNKPVADLIPHRKKSPFGLVQERTLAGAEYRCDPCAPVSDEDWPEDVR